MGRLKSLDPLLVEDVQDVLFAESGYAHRLAGLIADGVAPPFSISIDGDWGTGKTTMMKLLEGELKNRDNPLPTFWFSPWEYKGSSDIVLSFLKGLAGGFPDQLGEKAKNVGWFFQLLTVSGLDMVARLITNGALSTEMVEKNAKLLEKDFPDWEQHTDIVREIRNEFVRLTQVVSDEFDGRPVVVFLDDFDRCLPNDAIRLLEAINNLFLAKSDDQQVAQVIFVCGINTNIARYFISKHYGLGDTEAAYALNYFRKIFDLTISMPLPMSLHELVKNCFQDLDLESKLGESDYAKVIVEDMEHLRIRSIRKHLNIISNFFSIVTMNEIDGERERLIVLALIILKEVHLDLYEALRQWTFDNPDKAFHDMRNAFWQMAPKCTPEEIAFANRIFDRIGEFLDKPADYFGQYLV